MYPTKNPALQQLAGVWRLVSSTFSTSAGKVIYPLGENAEGLAIFTASGYLSAQLMRPGGPNLPPVTSRPAPPKRYRRPCRATGPTTGSATSTPSRAH